MINIIILIIFFRIDVYHGLDLELLEVLECKIKIIFVIIGEETGFSFPLLGSVAGTCKSDRPEDKLTGAEAYTFYLMLIFYFLCAWGPL